MSHIQFLIDKLIIVTPPSAVGYANGIAQSMASLARCIGPVVGGYVSWIGFFLFFFRFCFTKGTCTCQMWAISITDNPSGYYLGFVVCAVVCSLSFLQSYLIR
jgi:hypothetical protein